MNDIHFSSLGGNIVDNRDNCRKVFNPVRPMDGGVQADSDGDGKGDACDKCPLDVGPECTAIDPYTGETVYITDGDLNLTGTPELFLNRMARARK